MFYKTVSSSVSSDFTTGKSPWARSSDPCHFSEVENVQARMLKFGEQLDQDHKQIRQLPAAAWDSATDSSSDSIFNEEKLTGGWELSKYTNLPTRPVIHPGSRTLWEIAAFVSNKERSV